MTYLAHMSLDTRKFGRWAHRRRLSDNDSASHAFITELFGRQVLQPYRLYENDRELTLYAYTDHTDDALCAAMQITGTPDVLDIVAQRPRTKEMPTLNIGARVGFDLRFAPVRRIGSVERDAHAGGSSSREDDYLKWLATKIQPAAELEDFRMHRFQTRHSRRAKMRVQLPDVVAHGTVRVTDAEAFEVLLRGGVGRHKAYGYGMLLLRPADRG